MSGSTTPRPTWGRPAWRPAGSSARACRSPTATRSACWCRPAIEAAADGASGEPQQAIIAALLQLVPEPELSLNAAARRLAWGGDQQFARYRETDDKGHQRASKPLRTAILAACRQRCLCRPGRPLLRLHLQHAGPPDHAAPVRATCLDRRPRRRATRVHGGAMTPPTPVWTAVHTRPHQQIRACGRNPCGRVHTVLQPIENIACGRVDRVASLKGGRWRPHAPPAASLGEPRP